MTNALLFPDGLEPWMAGKVAAKRLGWRIGNDLQPTGVTTWLTIEPLITGFRICVAEGTIYGNAALEAWYYTRAPNPTINLIAAIAYWLDWPATPKDWARHDMVGKPNEYPPPLP